MKKQLTRTEVDGDKLKLAREAQGLSQKELALKLCLSHQHIAQLEGNRLAIFFTPAHKIQVAKKVGATLGLGEDEYLIHHAIEMTANEKASIPNPSFAPELPPENSELFVKSSIRPKIYKLRLLIIPALVVSSMAIAAGSQIFSNQLASLNLDQLISLKTPMSQLNALPVNAPPVENITIESPSITEESDLNNALVSNEKKSCSYQEQETTIYRTANPRKSAEMVYVLSKEHQAVCVIDGQNKVVSLDLGIGQSRSVYGQAPFTVISSDLSKFDLYFQGWKVKPGNSDAKSIRLEAVDLTLN